MAAPVLQFKRGLLANLPGLRAGEPGFTTDSYDLYVGIDSTTTNNKFFGSHRYWTRGTASTGSGVNLVEGTSTGTDYITLKSPDSLSGITTYTLPATPINTYLLTTNSSGVLSWTNSVPAVSFTGISTFSDTTDNTLGNADTGAVQIDGGLGINKNVTIGAGLSVAGQSYFIGTATFYGGQINLGDSDTDDIVVAGEFKSNLIPSDDATYNLGTGSKRWNNASFAGIVTATTGAVFDALRIGITAAGEIDTSTGSLTLDSASGQTIIDDNLSVTGITTLAGNITLGDNTSDDITVGGEFVSSLNPSTTNTYDLGTSSQRWRNAWFSGNVNVAGIITSVGYSDLTVANKDIVMAYIDGVTETDTTANHGGIAVASTEGTPLFNISVAGINTLPSTYKQLMWVKSGTFTGLATDAWMFNYGVAIGTSTMGNGVRLAVGSGVTISDTGVSATNFYGALTGNASSATQVKTQSAADNNATYHITFVDANNGSATNESVYTDDGIYYNPGTNTFTTQHAEFTGNVLVSGIATFASNAYFGAGDALYFGSDTALQIYSNGGNSVIKHTSDADTLYIQADKLELRSETTFEKYLTGTDGGSVELYFNNSKKLETTSTGVSITNDLNVSGTITGTATTATNANNINITQTTSTDTVTSIVLVANQSTGFQTAFIDSGLSYDANGDTLTVAGDVAINGGDVTTTAATGTVFNTTATTISAFGQATTLGIGSTAATLTLRPSTVVGTNATQNLYNTVATNLNFGGAATALVMGAATGIATINNATLTLPNATTVNVNGANPTLAGSSTGTLTLFNTNLTKVNAFQAATDVVLSATTGITTIRNKLTVGGNLELDGNVIQASDGNTNITLTSNTLTAFAGDIRVNGNDIQASDGNTNISLTSNTLTTFAGDIRVNGNDIQSSTGATVITFSADDATFASDLTVGGNLYVNGSTTQVNTSELQINDRTITLGIQTGTTASTTTWDLGVLMNYGDAGVAKTAGVIWEYGNERFVFSANSDNPSSSGTSSPNITVSTYAPIEVAELWVNNSCVSNTSTRIIGCTGSTLLLENITIDAGTF